MADTSPDRFAAGFHEAILCAIELWGRTELWHLLGRRSELRYVSVGAQPKQL